MKKGKKWRISVFLGALLVLSAVLGGCGKDKMTVESLIKEVTEQMNDVTSMSADMDMVMDMVVKESGMSVNVEMNADMAVEATKDPVASHISGSMSVNMMGISMELESYSVVEDGKLVTYSKAMDQWTRTEADDVETDQIDAIGNFFDERMEYSLNEKTEKVDGKEVYVLSTKITGEMIMDAMGSFSEDMGDLSGGMDFSGMEADVVMKIDAKTKYPVEIFVDLEDMLNSLVGEEVAGTEMAFEDCSLTYKFTGFNEVEAITVPDEAKNAVSSGDDSDALDDFLNGQDQTESESVPDMEMPEEEGPVVNADGTYLLKAYWGDGSVNIKTPEGFEVSEFSDESFLYFTDTYGQDFDEVSLNYGLCADDTEESLMEYYIDGLDYYQEDEDYTNVVTGDVQKVQTSRGEVQFVKTSYTFDEDGNYVEYYAILRLNDSLIVECNIEEYAYQQPCALIDESKIMETVFSAVAPL